MKIDMNISSTNGLSNKNGTIKQSGLNSYALVPVGAVSTFDDKFDAKFASSITATTNAINNVYTNIQDTKNEILSNVNTVLTTDYLTATQTSSNITSSVQAQTANFVDLDTAGSWYGLKVATGSNGKEYITGFDTGALLTPDGPSSYFRISADKFVVGGIVDGTGEFVTPIAGSNELPVFTIDVNAGNPEVVFNGKVTINSIPTEVTKFIGSFVSVAELNSHISTYEVILNDGDTYRDSVSNSIFTYSSGNGGEWISSSSTSTSTSLSLTANSTVFTYDKDNNVYYYNPDGSINHSQPAIEVTATPIGTTGTLWYEYFNSVDNVLFPGVNGPTLAFLAPQLFTDMPYTVVARVRQDNASGPILGADSITFIGLKDTTSGIDAITVEFPNVSQVVTADSNGNNPILDGTGGYVKMYSGTSLLTFTTNTTLSDGQWRFSSVTTDTGLSLGTTTATSGYVTLGNITSFTVDAATATYVLEYRVSADNYGTRSIKQSFSKAKAGASGAAASSYYIETSTNVLTKTGTVFSPTTITVNAKKLDGAGVVSSYAGRFKIYENGSSTASYTSVTDTQSYTYTPSTSCTSIQVELYQAGGTTVKLDMENIAVVSNGANGVNAVTATYSNTNVGVPVTTAGGVTWTGSGGTLKVFEGTTPLILNNNSQVAGYPSTAGRFNVDIRWVSGDTITEPTITGALSSSATFSAWSGAALVSTAGYVADVYVTTSTGSNVLIPINITIVPNKQGATGATGATGNTGATGASVSSVTNYYQITNSTTAPTSGWTSSPSVPSATYPYLWNYSVITKSDSTSISTTAAIIGTYSANGTNGVSVTAITTYYGINNDSTSSAGITWSTSSSIVATASNKYLWSYTKFDYSNSTSTQTTPVVIGNYGVRGSAFMTYRGIDAFSIGGANSVISNTFGAGATAVKGDTIVWTQTDANGVPTSSTIRDYTGATWSENTGLVINGNAIINGTVSTNQLAANAVDATKIAAGSITTSKLSTTDLTVKNLQATSGTTTIDINPTVGIKGVVNSVTKFHLPVDGTTPIISGATITNGTTTFGSTGNVTIGTPTGLGSDGLSWNGTNFSIAGTVFADGGNIGGWSINGDYIGTGTVTLDSNNEYTTATGIKLSGAGSIHSKNFVITSAGDAKFRGYIEANSGNIGGWGITSSELHNGNMTVSSSGGITITNGTSTTFSVNNTGYLTSTSGNIGGWDIATTGISKGSTSLSSAGKLTTTDALIGGWTVNGSGIYNGTQVTNAASTYSTAGSTLTSSGTIHTPYFYSNATGAGFQGSITGASGTIGGWTLNGSGITNGTTTLGTNGSITAGSGFSVTTAGVMTAKSGTIGGWTINDGYLSGSGSIEMGNDTTGNFLRMDSSGLYGYSSKFGASALSPALTFSIPSDGSAPTFSSGIIKETVYEISTNSIIRTSETVGNGASNGKGLIIDNNRLRTYKNNSNDPTAELDFSTGSLTLGTDSFTYDAVDGSISIGADSITYDGPSGTLGIKGVATLNKGKYNYITTPNRPLMSWVTGGDVSSNYNIDSALYVEGSTNTPNLDVGAYIKATQTGAVIESTTSDGSGSALRLISAAGSCCATMDARALGTNGVNIFRSSGTGITVGNDPTSANSANNTGTGIEVKSLLSGKGIKSIAVNGTAIEGTTTGTGYAGSFTGSVKVAATTTNPVNPLLITATNGWNWEFQNDGSLVHYAAAGASDPKWSITHTGVFTALSDRKLKENINSTEMVGLDVIKNIEVVDYDFKKEQDNPGRKTGFIAQDLELVYPKAVSSIGDTKAVSYNELIPVLIKSNQELLAKVEALEARLTKLESTNGN